MGYLFTLLYLLTAYVTPPVLFGPLSEFHIEVIVIVLAIIFSIPSLFQSRLLSSPLMLAFAGMSFTIIVGFLQIGWLGGAFGALYGFMQPCFAFFLVAVNCRTRRHLQWIVLALVLGSILFMTLGIFDLRNNVIPSEYIYGDGDLRRIRGLGFVHDPNDFAQIMVSLMPAMFFWRKKGSPVTLLLIGVALTALLAGMFFTHSRGASLALTAVILIAARRKIGTVPAAVIAGILLAGTFAVGWSGGRDVSMDAGADRLDLWYGGLEMIKSHPFFGIGFGGFADRFGITAHNSVIICAAETGMIGLFFWVLLLFITFRTGISIGNTGPDKKKDDKGIIRFGQPPVPMEETTVAKDLSATVPVAFPKIPISLDSVREMASTLIVSLTGFLVAGWFLSRAYSLWLFMYCGMMFAVLRMGEENGLTPKRDTMKFLLGWTGAITCMLIVIVSLILRFRNF